MKYAFFKQSGDPDSFHDDDTVVELPTDALELTEDQWLVRWRLKANIGGISITADQVQPIEALKSRALVNIDIACGQRRAAAVSTGTYIAEEYRRAYEDALAFQSAAFTGQVPPSIQVWATVSGITPQASAQEIIAARNSYMELLDVIRSIRLRGKAAVEIADTPEEILVALTTVNADLLAL